MTRTWTLAALAALTLAPAVAAAQEPAPRARPRVRTRVEPGPYSIFSWTGNARIGVLVKTAADATNDKIGARVEAVTPGGPAEKVGLKAGDIITRFNGTALGGVASEDDNESGPAMKLIELAHELDPGDSVQVEYRRGSETRRASLVADEGEWSGSISVNSFPNMDRIMPQIEFGQREFELLGGSPWGGIELVSLNPDLGEYFGTREGVLVVRASEDSSLQLKGGDVILAIGGRKPSSPMHAMRILRSYDVGETVTIDVQRKQRRTTITWKVPEAEDHFKFAPRARNRMRESPTRFRIAPKVRMAPVLGKVSRAYRTI